VRVSDRLARSRDLDLSVSYALETSVMGPQARWILSLRNRTSRALRVSFPTSQYANVVLRRGGKIIYSWSAKRGFAQAVSGRRLGAGATYVCTLGPDPLDLEPGRYELIAHLAGKTKPALTRRSLLVRG
jgi:Intracellular proteinase inhibitor